MRVSTNQPIWAGVVLRFADGSLMTWQLSERDGPLSLQQTLTTSRAELFSTDPRIEIDLHLHGTARGWDDVKVPEQSSYSAIEAGRPQLEQGY